MSAERKVSDEELERLRRLADDEGWTHADLAVAFGITPQHVGRLVREEQRPRIGGLDADLARTSVSDAVESLLEELDLDAAEVVLAAMARTLAAKLDGCAESPTATAAAAIPRLSAELVDVLDRLQDRQPAQPDYIDEMRARRQARLLATVAQQGRRGAS
jgi:transcriptional regulator with XRE-family HTH domain